MYYDTDMMETDGDANLIAQQSFYSLLLDVVDK